MCIYIYIYIYIYIIYTRKCIGLRTDGEPGRLCEPRRRGDKRVLEYGVQAQLFYGNLREKTAVHKYLQETCLFLQKSPKVSGNLREFTGECNLGILYSSSLLGEQARAGDAPAEAGGRPCERGAEGRIDGIRPPRPQPQPQKFIICVSLMELVYYVYVSKQK